MIQIPTNENVGVLAVLWDDNILELDEVAITGQEIHVMVKVRMTNDTWLMNCIYASTIRDSRKILWQHLKIIKDNFCGNWLLGGDFN